MNRLNDLKKESRPWAKAISRAVWNGRSDTREALLDAASALMIETDGIDFSVADLAQKSGMSGALVQYHFGSKDGLRMAVVERSTVRMAEQLAALEKMDIPAIKKLHMHIRGLLTAYIKAPFINELINFLMKDVESERAKHVSEIFVKPVATFYRSLIAQGVQEGTFREIDPMHFYFIVVGACDHITARRSALFHVFGIDHPSKSLSYSYAETVYEIILAGISSTERPNTNGVKASGAF